MGSGVVRRGEEESETRDVGTKVSGNELNNTHQTKQTKLTRGTHRLINISRKTSENQEMLPERRIARTSGRIVPKR